MKNRHARPTMAQMIELRERLWEVLRETEEVDTVGIGRISGKLALLVYIREGTIPSKSIPTSFGGMPVGVRISTEAYHHACGGRI